MPESNTPREGPVSSDYPAYPSHYLPRTRTGRWVVSLFLVLFALTQPPLVFVLANRIDPRICSLPFLYAYLLMVYLLLIGVLIWGHRKDL